MSDETSTGLLQAKIEELEAKQTDLLAQVESKENEFGKKRAQFKEMFLQKETELNNQITTLQIATKENARLLDELNEVSAERDNLKTAVLITKTSNDEEFQALISKYQEEITSLKAIMQDAVLETRQETSEKYEKEQQKLIKANHELETKLIKYKTQIKELKSIKQPPEDPDGNDGLFDVLSGTWKRPASPEDNSKDNDENLEESMKKAQENAETLRAIVMPLEEEIATLRSKLKNANEKINVFEAKEKKLFKSQSDPTGESTTISSVNVTELEEKVKELSQYLEAERSSRTDLEMFVAVLNTQKGVLQEDADKLRRELHNVCRLLEQEKEEHVALKDTWEMANDRFLETQRVQKIEQAKIRQLLTAEQQKLLKSDLKQVAEPVKLLTPPSPALKSRFHRKNKEPGNKLIKTTKITASEAKRTLSNLVRGQKNNSTSPPSSILDADIPSLDTNSSPPLLPVTGHHTTAPNDQPASFPGNGILPPCIEYNEKPLSDGENIPTLNEIALKKHKSADDLEQTGLSGTFNSRSKSHDFDRQGNLEKSYKLEDFVAKHGKEKIDWKGFEEAAKSSFSNETDRACAMCSNYEKQLQSLQRENEELVEKTTFLMNQLSDEQETVTVVKRAQERLEQSIKIASEDAQAQITAAGETQRYLESILEEINNDIFRTNNEAAQEMKKIMEDRDNYMARCEQLSENYINQQSKLQNKKHEVGELSENNPSQKSEDQTDEFLSSNELQTFQAASKTKMDKLQSEIHFMKDRIMAEQVAKENIEEFYQAEMSRLENDIKKLHRELDMEKQQNKQLGQQPQLLFEGNASNEVIAVLEKQLQQASKEKAEHEKQLKELKSQIHSLNSQLNSSESVQRDFVKLSQSLQMKLEELKESRQEINWEHEDDVTSCRKCKKELEVTQDKHHCKQCGKIFCDVCTNKTINSPGSHNPLRVCVDCHDVIRREVHKGLDEELIMDKTMVEDDTSV